MKNEETPTPWELIAERIRSDGYDPAAFTCGYFAPSVPGLKTYEKNCPLNTLPDEVDSFTCWDKDRNIHYSFEAGREPQIIREDGSHETSSKD